MAGEGQGLEMNVERVCGRRQAESRLVGVECVRRGEGSVSTWRALKKGPKGVCSRSVGRGRRKGRIWGESGDGSKTDALAVFIYTFRGSASYAGGLVRHSTAPVSESPHAVQS